MSENKLFDKVNVIKDKFKKFFGHKKKIKALENYSQAVPMRHVSYLALIKKCMYEGFLDEKEADFLDHLLSKYEINYLQWSYKTKYIKRQMRDLARESYKPDPQMFLFDLDKKRQNQSYEVPVQLLNNGKSSSLGRRL